MNLGILSSVTLFNKLSPGGSQLATVHVSTGSAFAVFCLIILYHCFRRLVKSRCFGALLKGKSTPLLKVAGGYSDNEDSCNDPDDDDMLVTIDSDRRA